MTTETLKLWFAKTSKKVIIITTLNDKKKTNQECYIGIVQCLGFKYSKALCFTNLKPRMKENKEWNLNIWLKKYKYSDVATYCILAKKRMFSSQI